ncbi:MAG: kynureninase [Acidobacteriota bacterium]
MRLIDEQEALALDRDSPLSRFRSEFCLPHDAAGRDLLYFCGNSLGLMPRRARAIVTEELDDWAEHAVEGHFRALRPWFSYHEQFREAAAQLVGALPSEVVMMNSLTVNLHLMLATFFRPQGERRAILMEEGAFPSDLYAVQSQLQWHGLDPERDLIVARPRDGEDLLRREDIERLLERDGPRIALMLFGGVHYYTGQWFEMKTLTQAAQRQGIVCGWDLAHAAGNVPLSLHDWNVDWAAWCSYKYLNAGPGAVAGCFVHERHGNNTTLPRFGGWWGNDPATRFEMRAQRRFIPRQGADGWQLSNPPILSLAPLLASLQLFQAAGIDALREKSLQLTGALEALIEALPNRPFGVITPRDPAQRGAQLSLRIDGDAAAFQHRLQARGVIADRRDPDVIRLAPAPLYNSFHEVWRLAAILAELGASA